MLNKRIIESSLIHKNSLYRYLLVAVTLLLTSTGMLIAQETTGGQRSLIILHTNDQHFNHRFVDAFKSVIDRFRAQYKNVLMLEAGDFSIREERWEQRKIATNTVSYTEHLTRMVNIMKMFEYDVVVPGNHDLGYHQTITRDLLKTLNSTFLGANVTVTTDNYLQLEPVYRRTFDDGLKVAILGLCGGGYGKAEGITLSPHMPKIIEYKHLRNECDVFILLTHLSVTTDRKIAQQHGGELIDVIVGGHSHTYINPSEMLNGVLIAQTGGGYGKKQYLGTVRLILDKNGKIIEKEGEVLTFTDKDQQPVSRFLR